MAITNDEGKPRKGRAGAYTFYQRNGQTIMRICENRVGSPTRTKSNMAQKTKLINVINSWRAFQKSLKGNFEERRPGQTDYNVFVGINTLNARVFLTKEEVDNQTQVADNFIVSHGTLLPVIELRDEGEMVVTSIGIGDLQIDERTRLDDLAFAIGQHNKGFYESWDELLFYRTRNTHYRGDQFEVEHARMAMDVRDSRRVWDLFGEGNALSCNGFLASRRERDSLLCWVHRRPQGKDRYLVTTQALFGDNTLLARYATDAARQEAINSYGPLKQGMRYASQLGEVVNEYTNKEE